VIGVWPELPENGEHSPRVSGSLDGHYAPRTPTRLVASAQLSEILGGLEQAGTRYALLAYTAPNDTPHALARRQLSEDPEVYAREIYSALRELDRAGAALIVVEAPPVEPEWEAVNDRLARAARGSRAGA